MKFVKFTNEDGENVWINPSHVIGVSLSDRKNNMTDITTLKWIYTVKESVDEVVNKLEI